jgi:hypothetical protein
LIINICDHDCTELWDRILYKKLSEYPKVSDWEMKNIIDFVNYEEKNGREAVIISDKDSILDYVNKEITKPEKYRYIARPNKITECTACRYRKGCMTHFLCHTSPLENAMKILNGGKLLSAVKARKLPAEVLMKEPRNAANDPEDFFNYVMFTWGNCQAGDRLVMERKMNRPPTEEDMSINLTPGVRFYFEYEKLETHPGAVHDGFLPLKIKDEVDLLNSVYAIIVPNEYKSEIERIIPHGLVDKTYYLENDCKDVWDWSEKVYKFIEELVLMRK